MAGGLRLRAPGGSLPEPGGWLDGGGAGADPRSVTGASGSKGLRHCNASGCLPLGFAICFPWLPFCCKLKVLGGVRIVMHLMGTMARSFDGGLGLKGVAHPIKGKSPLRFLLQLQS